MIDSCKISLRFKKAIFSFLIAMLFVATASASSMTLEEAAKGVWRLDGWNNATVRNFRVASSTTSASAQPSSKGLVMLYDILKGETLSDTPIYMVDLRQESHGYADGVPVSWYKEHNHANFGKSVAEIEQDETSRLKSLLRKMTKFVPLGNHDTATLDPLTLIVQDVKTEQELATNLGFRYVRFSAADQVFPAPETVDEFIKFYLKLPKNHWLHFHCHAGHGRTTTFLVFYDILKYPDLSLEEIVKRQHDLGGSDLLAYDEEDDWYSQMRRDRAEKIRKFYQYVNEERKLNFSTSWADYISKNS